MVDYAERLAGAMKHSGATKTTLANAIGISYQAVKKVLDGGSRSLSAENNAKAARFLGVSSHWLATGDGEMLEGASSSAAVAVSRPPQEPAESAQMSETAPLMADMQAGNTSRRAPVVAWARLGDVVFEEVINKANSLAFAPIGDHGDRVILVPIADDALAPRLRIGDMVAIDLDNKQPDRDQVTLFMAKADGAFFLRRYQPLVAPHFEAIDAKNGALDSQRHGLEIIGVRCGVRLADI